jgi:DnaJ-class molecular chaperone
MPPKYTDEELLSRYKLQIDKKVITSVCPRCMGEGTYYEEKCTSYHRGEYDYVPHFCTTCQGYGLVNEVTRTVVAFPIGYSLSPQSHYETKNNPYYERKSND